MLPHQAYIKKNKKMYLVISKIPNELFVFYVIIVLYLDVKQKNKEKDEKTSWRGCIFYVRKNVKVMACLVLF